MKITTIGLDIAKRFFHVVCCNEQGRLINKSYSHQTRANIYLTTNNGLCLWQRIDRVAIPSILKSSYS